MSLFKELKYLLSKRQPELVSPHDIYAYKTRFSILGTIGSGKSTWATLMVITTQSLSRNLPNFKCRVLEKTSTILSDASRMRLGKFPEKTKAYETYAAESGLMMGWETWRGSKNIQIPICDIAGEDIQVMIQRFSKNVGNIGAGAFSAAMNLINYVKDSDGFILTVPASKAVGVLDEQIEKESKDVFFDPDVNLHRILDEIITYKESVHKRVKGIAVVITKWDELRPYVESQGIDIYDQTGQGIKDFMNVYFPSTSQLLKSNSIGMDKVRFFPSYVDLEYNKDGTKKTWKDGSNIIKIKRRDALGKPIRKPSYPEQQYVNLIEYLRTFAN